VILPLLAAVSRAAEDPATTRREIQSITKRLNDLSVWFSDAEKRQRDWQKELKRTDETIAETGRAIRALEHELAVLKKELSGLEAERSKLEAARNEQARYIADHLAAAYRLQGQDFFKMLLNQESPERFERMIRYHQYFSKARTESLEAYGATLAELEQNAAASLARERSLRDRQQTLDAERTELVEERRERERHLSSLDSEMKDRSRERERLNKDRSRLEQLLAEITRRAKGVDAAFAASRGKLPWPIRGRVKHAFGQARAGGHLKWQGIYIAAAEGSPVTAVHRGRVAFADWLRGFGLLTIVDHGNGFMSLYAHADVIYKQVGDWVESGEALATAGRSGGQTEPGLYFEIRAKGSPVDPIVWLTKR